MAAVRVGTLSLVFPVGTFLAHVATEVTLEAGPVSYRAVPGVVGARKTLRKF